MKIAVVCANGRVGSLVVKEALARGLDVTAIARGENRTEAAQYVAKDLFDLTAQDLASYDAVVDCFGVWEPDKLSQHSQSLKHLCDLLSGTKTRLLVVGGAGSLFVDRDHSAVLCDSPDFPEDYRPLAKAQQKALEELRQRGDVVWTFVSPAADFQAQGETTGQYLLGGEELRLNDRGESVISYGDYALAMVDEIEKGHHLQQRISVVRK